jgi:uncharacterized protein (DUF302 family)
VLILQQISILLILNYFIMNKLVVTGILSFVIGVLIAMVVMFKMAPGLMLKEDVSPHGFQTTVSKFEEAVLMQGWKIPAVHDLQATMHNFGKTLGPVKVFELCHPDHAEKILRESEERIVSTMMPCRVAIYEKADGKVYVSRMNSGLVAKTMGGIINEVMQEAFADNEKMIEAAIR